MSFFNVPFEVVEIPRVEAGSKFVMPANAGIQVLSVRIPEAPGFRLAPE
jgi:hypothetical protein